MKNTKIQDIKTLVETPFVGLYEVNYKNKLGDDRTWTVASRKNRKELKEIYLNNKEDKIDAVVIAAYHKDTNKLVLIKQFRVPINDYIYELPAGLVDNDEKMEEAVKRELKEETGLELVKINSIRSKSKIYLSPGMTDESVAFVNCTCKGEISDEFLEEDEEIEAILVSQEEAKSILQGNEEIDIKAFLILQMFAEIGENLFL
ncbi:MULTISPECIES: NUDIX hydrolase [unclassified Romboutsia]|uniref:NUDIX hydrolase n=1 Tax=unclassified Romboutsia TaxID=2626894 RepID=UPI000820EE4B|nr:MULTISPECIES: NUDIX hydrolase [unclassified Romboutsia]SCH61219.1 ADP-ribose pyrophosphatase [uncultured Clostridium sp.]